MNSDQVIPSQSEGERLSNARTARPGWADGLRQFYDSVVEEPLPESFKELLAKLDEND